jgi:muramidase (phage lysozyme)
VYSLNADGTLSKKVEQAQPPPPAQASARRIPGNTKPLLDMIASGEANSDGYNSVWGARGVNLTGMTLREVQDFQRKRVEEDGAKSSAMGRYQFIRSTLAETADQLGLTGEELFDEALQDKLATQLLKVQGLEDYQAGSISAEQFMDKIAQRWMAVPKDSTGAGYGDGDGLNNANIQPDAALAAIRQARPSSSAASPPVPVDTSRMSTGTKAAGANFFGGAPADPRFKVREGNYFRTTQRSSGYFGGRVNRGIERGWQQTGGLFGQLAKLVGDEFGFSSLAEVGDIAITQAYAEAIKNPGSIHSIDDIRTGADVTSFLAQNLGEQIPNLLISAVTGGMGAFFGKAAVGNAVATNIAKRAAAKKITEAQLRKQMMNKGAVRGSLAGIFAGFLPINTGEVIQEQRDAYESVENQVNRNPNRAIDEPDLFSAGLIGTLSTAFETLGMGIVGRIFFRGIKKEVAEHSLRTVLRRVGQPSLKSLAVEGGTEMVQEALVIASRKAVDPQFSITEALSNSEGLGRIAFAGLSGAGIGGMLGGAGGVAHVTVDGLRMARDRSNIRSAIGDVRKTLRGMYNSDPSAESAEGEVAAVSEVDIAAAAVDVEIGKVETSIDEAVTSGDQEKINAVLQEAVDLLEAIETSEIPAQEEATELLVQARKSISGTLTAMKRRVAAMKTPEKGTNRTKKQDKETQKNNKLIEAVLAELNNEKTTTEERIEQVYSALEVVEKILTKTEGTGNPLNVNKKHLQELLTRASNVALTHLNTTIGRARKAVSDTKKRSIKLNGAINRTAKKAAAERPEATPPPPPQEEEDSRGTIGKAVDNLKGLAANLVKRGKKAIPKGIKERLTKEEAAKVLAEMKRLGAAVKTAGIGGSQMDDKASPKSPKKQSKPPKKESAKSVRELTAEYKRLKAGQKSRRARLKQSDKELSPQATDRGLSVKAYRKLLADNLNRNEARLRELKKILASPETAKQKKQEEKSASNIKFKDAPIDVEFEEGSKPTKKEKKDKVKQAQKKHAEKKAAEIGKDAKDAVARAKKDGHSAFHVTNAEARKAAVLALQEQNPDLSVSTSGSLVKLTKRTAKQQNAAKKVDQARAKKAEKKTDKKPKKEKTPLEKHEAKKAAKKEAAAKQSMSERHADSIARAHKEGEAAIQEPNSTKRKATVLALTKENPDLSVSAQGSLIKLTPKKGQRKAYAVTKKEPEVKKVETKFRLNDLTDQEEALLFALPVESAEYYAYVERLNEKYASGKAASKQQSTKREESGIKFEESNTALYAERTRKNAAAADITIDFSQTETGSGGKSGLTKRATKEAGKVYVNIRVDKDGKFNEQEALAAIDEAITESDIPFGAVKVNVAGHGLSSLKAEQASLDAAVESLLRKVHKKHNLESVRSGGQTGFDEAGAKAGQALGLPTTVLAPKHWKFRPADGQDRSNSIAAFKKRFAPTKQSTKREEPSAERNAVTEKQGKRQKHGKAPVARKTLDKEGRVVPAKDKDGNIIFDEAPEGYKGDALPAHLSDPRTPHKERRTTQERRKELKSQKQRKLAMMSAVVHGKNSLAEFFRAITSVGLVPGLAKALKAAGFKPYLATNPSPGHKKRMTVASIPDDLIVFPANLVDDNPAITWGEFRRMHSDAEAIAEAVANIAEGWMDPEAAQSKSEAAQQDMMDLEDALEDAANGLFDADELFKQGVFTPREDQDTYWALSNNGTLVRVEIHEADDGTQGIFLPSGKEIDYSKYKHIEDKKTLKGKADNRKNLGKLEGADQIAVVKHANLNLLRGIYPGDFPGVAVAVKVAKIFDRGQNYAEITTEEDGSKTVEKESRYVLPVKRVTKRDRNGKVTKTTTKWIHLGEVTELGRMLMGKEQKQGRMWSARENFINGLNFLTATYDIVIDFRPNDIVFKDKNGRPQVVKAEEHHRWKVIYGQTRYGDVSSNPNAFAHTEFIFEEHTKDGEAKARWEKYKKQNVHGKVTGRDMAEWLVQESKDGFIDPDSRFETDKGTKRTTVGDMMRSEYGLIDREELDAAYASEATDQDVVDGIELISSSIRGTKSRTTKERISYSSRHSLDRLLSLENHRENVFLDKDGVMIRETNLEYAEKHDIGDEVQMSETTILEAEPESGITQYHPGRKKTKQVDNSLTNEDGTLWSAASKAVEITLRLLGIKEKVVLFDEASALRLKTKYEAMRRSEAALAVAKVMNEDGTATDKFVESKKDRLQHKRLARMYSGYIKQIDAAVKSGKPGRIINPYVAAQYKVDVPKAGHDARITHIFVSQQASKNKDATRSLILMHEIGHLVQYTHLDRLPAKLRKKVLDSLENGTESFANWMALEAARLGEAELAKELEGVIAVNKKRKGKKWENSTEKEVQNFFTQVVRDLKRVWDHIKDILGYHKEKKNAFYDFVTALNTHADIQRGEKRKPFALHATPEELTTPLARQIFLALQEANAGAFIADRKVGGRLPNFTPTAEQTAARSREPLFQSYVDDWRNLVERFKKDAKATIFSVLGVADAELRAMGLAHVADHFHLRPGSTSRKMGLFAVHRMMMAPHLRGSSTHMGLNNAQGRSVVESYHRSTATTQAYDGDSPAAQGNRRKGARLPHVPAQVA